MEFNVSLLLLIGLVGATVNSELLARTNSSNLCSRTLSQSCLHQLKTFVDETSNTTKTCRVEMANNTYNHRCDDRAWNHLEVCHAGDGCGVNLEVYRHMPLQSIPLYRTAFNLSLVNITSREVRLRYRDTHSQNFSFCINFTTSSNVVNPFESLWYDCVFHERLHEGHPFQLEFISRGKYGLFLFQVPTGKLVITIWHHSIIKLVSFCSIKQKKASRMGKAFCMFTYTKAHISSSHSRTHLVYIWTDVISLQFANGFKTLAKLKFSM